MVLACRIPRSSCFGTVGKALLAAAAVCTAMPGGWPAGARPLRDVYVIEDRGQRREFEVARDEFHLGGTEPQILRFPPLPSAEAARQHAVQLRGNTTSEIAMVLYERTVRRSEFSRRLLTRAVLVRLGEKAELHYVMSEVLSGIPGTEVLPLPFRHWHLFRASDPDGAFDLGERLRLLPEVVFAEVQLAAVHEKKFIPNDPLFSSQWHLANTGQNGGVPGNDIGVTSVWEAWRGSGVIVGVVDNGIQSTHPDLAVNLLPALATNLNSNTFSTASDRHGTAVAGLIAARGENNMGGAGVAFDARLADIRLLGEATTDAQDAFAMLHANDQIHLKNNSWGAADGTGALEGAGQLMTAALVEATDYGRGGLGTILVFAGGNGRNYGENVNYDGYANSPCVIAVGALTDQGDLAAYSEPGACLSVSAPSGSGTKLCSNGRQALTTTDLLDSAGYNYPAAFCELSSPDYTQNFSGTSGAAALVSGVIALMLDATPTLGWRDAKEIVMRSARKILPTDPDWFTNSAGISHNHRLGAGLINAQRAVDMATQWQPLPALRTISQAETELNLPLPDNDAGGIVRLLTFTNSGFRVESVALRLNAPHQYHGDLAVTLTSPSGATSRMAERHNSSGSGYNGWTFTSVRHWGESARGTWAVKVADLSPTKTGTLQAVQLDLLGCKPEARLGILRTNGVWHLSIVAPAPGWNCVLDTSTDLLTWRQVASLRIPDNGRASFDDPPDTGDTRFYRAQLVE